MTTSLTMLMFSAAVLLGLSASCRFKSSVSESSENSNLVAIPFAQAGGLDAAALARVHGEATASAPAALRPDPDLYARRLLKQFRQDGNTLARQLGVVEQYRLLLGGASDDFRTMPQESYDATSLLTLQKVAQEICVSLVNPTSANHPGWQTVLPNAPSDVEKNVRWLMSKMHALPSSSLDSSAVSELAAMVREDAVDGVVSGQSYVNACTAMALDAEALLL